MNRYFLEFINLNEQRILIDLNDISRVEESKENCKIFLYSEIYEYVLIKENYNIVIDKLKNYFNNLNN
jgi:hypothetical protein